MTVARNNYSIDFHLFFLNGM